MKKTVGVIFGGKSAEHDVSIITAHLPIIKALLASGKYEVIPVYITKDGHWYSDEKMLDLEYFKENLDQKISKLNPLEIDLNQGFKIIKKDLFPKKIKIDVVFPAMHGTYGEDGSLMGLLRMANVPFVGCDIFASAVAMDKALTKQVLQSEQIPTVPFVWFTKSDWEKENNSILEKIKKLNWPLFIKPVHLGSSIAITKAKTEEELLNAVEVALHYDDKVLVEESVENLIEVTLPIMGNEDPEPSIVQRSLSGSEFFDFNEKYISNGKKTSSVNNASIEMPAKIEEGLINKVTELGIKTYKTLGCEGIARVDFLINNNTKEIFVNEVNTLPGSLYDHNWRKKGISNVDLINKLIDLAEERFDREKNTNFNFKSNILNQVGGAKFQQN